jgi:hypothetical protein
MTNDLNRPAGGTDFGVLGEDGGLSAVRGFLG